MFTVSLEAYFAFNNFHYITFMYVISPWCSVEGCHHRRRSRHHYRRPHHHHHLNQAASVLGNTFFCGPCM